MCCLLVGKDVERSSFANLTKATIVQLGDRGNFAALRGSLQHESSLGTKEDSCRIAEFAKRTPCTA